MHSPALPAKNTHQAQLAVLLAVATAGYGRGFGVRVLLAALYSAIVPVAFFASVSRFYPQLGLFQPGLNPTVGAAAFICCLVPTLFIPLRLTRPSHICITVLYLCVYVPSVAISPFFEVKHGASAFYTMIVMLLSFACFAMVTGLPDGHAPRTSRPVSGLLLATLFLASIALLYVWSLVSFRISLSFDDIYVRRFEARQIAPAGSVSAYAYQLLRLAIVPMCLLLGIIYKELSLLLIAALGAIASFSFDGSRSSISGPLMMLLLTLLVASRHRHKILPIATLAGTIGVSIAAIEVFFIGEPSLLGRLPLRLVLVPGFLTNVYWRFFSDHPFAMLSGTRLDGLIWGSPYGGKSLGYIVGEDVFMKPEMNANANLWASGFGTFGAVGVFVAVVVGALLLRQLDRLSHQKFVMGTIVCLAFGLNWVNGSVQSILLSGGGLILAAALSLSPPVGEGFRRSGWTLLGSPIRRSPSFPKMNDVR